MKRILFETRLSKIYIIAIALITLLIIGGYFSYAMFTVSKEKENAISIVTGNLVYELKVDNETTEKIVAPANSSKIYNVTLTNPNNRKARFNFYYEGKLDSGVEVGYIAEEGANIPSSKEGVNLEKAGASGSSNVYKIIVINNTSSVKTINLGVSVGLDYNDLTLPSNGHLFNKYEISFLDAILKDNEVKTPVEKMFNYASNGYYFDINTNKQSETANLDYVTEGLYSAFDEDGISYYYRGNVENNNVQFGKYDKDYYVYNKDFMYFQSLDSCKEYSSDCNENDKIKLASAGDKMYWKIVRVNGDGSLRLLYNGTSPSLENKDIASSYLIGVYKYNIASDLPKYVGYTYDDGTDSLIKIELDTWYKNTLGSNSYDSKVLNGRFCNDTSGYKPASDYGITTAQGTFFMPIDRVGQYLTKWKKDNSPSLKCPTTSEDYGGSYSLKVGLITVDEADLAGENNAVLSNTYLSAVTGFNYWTMSPAVLNWDGVDIFELRSSYQYSSNTHGYSGIRPVINISADASFIVGDGTISNPYVIS